MSYRNVKQKFNRYRIEQAFGILFIEWKDKIKKSHQAASRRQNHIFQIFHIRFLNVFSSI